MNRKEFLQSLGPVPQEHIDRAMAAGADPKIKERYCAQLGQMRRNAENWLAERPGADVKIQFNFPPKVGVIAPISEAIKHNFVSTNAEGLELLKAIWPRWDDDTEPTVLMVRGVLDSLNK